MCKYCKNVKTGDDYEPLIELKLNFGMIGKPEVCVYITHDLKLCTHLYNPNPDFKGNIDKSIKIKYCPMCGERL